MPLKIIYGTSGTGKTTFCLNQIKNNIKTEEKLLLITPEQFSFNAEKSLLDILDANASINAEVLSFKRIAERVLESNGSLRQKTLSKSAKSMLIYYILQKNKQELKLLSKANNIEGNVDILSRTITEFKRHSVTIEDLNNSLNDIQDNYLKLKIQEITAIYEKFSKAVADNFLDADDYLTMLLNKIEEAEFLKNSIVWIDEFTGFTKQEYKIIEKLMFLCKEVNVTICSDSLILDENKKEIDIFYTSKKTVNKLINLANENNIEILSPVFLNNKYRYKNEELKILSNTNSKETFQNETTALSLSICQDAYSEVENVAKNIIKLVKNEDMKFRDIAVITKNKEGYSNLISAIFNQYKIPMFMDIETDLSSNIVIKYILSIFDILSKNWSYEAVFNYLKTNLTSLEEDEINYIENYCLRWGIKGNAWYKDNFKYSDIRDEQLKKEELKKVNDIREKVVKPIIEIKEKLSKQKTVYELTKAIYENLQEQNVFEKFNFKIEYLKQIGNVQMANEYTLVWNILISTLDDIVAVLGEETVSFENYKNILKCGLMQNKVSTIPSTLDQVIIGDTDRTRSHKVKAVFIIGVVDGVFPTTNSDEGFINDKNRQELEGLGIELAKDTKEMLLEDEYNIYKAITTAEEYLFLSFPTSNLEGAPLRQAALIGKIKRKFPNLKVESLLIEKEELQEELINTEIGFEKLVKQIRKWANGEEIQEKWFEIFLWYESQENWNKKLMEAIRGIEYTNSTKNISSEIISKLYGESLKTSISKLENYRACNFLYYLQYGLNAKPREEFTIQNIEIGTFMHNVIDRFFEELENKGIKIDNLEKDLVDELIKQIIDEILLNKKNYMFSANAKYIQLSIKLRRVVTRAIWIIISELKKSKFEVLGHELSFGGKNEDFPEVVVKLPNGRKVTLTGKIDRIDIAEGEDGKYIRIIDYKSSSKDLNLSNVYYGLQLQLLTYLDMAVSAKNYKPAGVLYFDLSEPTVRTKSDISEEELEKLIEKQFKMKGLILANVDVFKLMDKTMENESTYLPIKLNKDGSIAKSSKVATEEQFKNLQKHIKKLLKEISSEILGGKIDINPYWNNKKTPCNYCKFKPICNFDINLPGNKYNYIKQFSNEEIFNKINLPN